LTDAGHASPGRYPPAPYRSGHGCLWGCLIAVLIALGVFAVAISYSGWWLTSGFKSNKTLHFVVETINSEQIARAVLGDNIRIVDLQSSSISSDTTTGTHEAFVARVQGSKAEGTLNVTVETRSGNSRITSMILTGPDGSTYDLTISRPLAPPGSI
jgi:hypothetical protein